MLYPCFLSPVVSPSGLSFTRREQSCKGFLFLRRERLTTILGEIKDDYSNRISATTGTINGKY
ncbi:MAG: hypothetical protein RLZZ532_782 [Cyanobacteriota bacterium]|jgi:hypothetical protein